MLRLQGSDFSTKAHERIVFGAKCSINLCCELWRRAPSQNIGEGLEVHYTARL